MSQKYMAPVCHPGAACYMPIRSSPDRTVASEVHAAYARCRNARLSLPLAAPCHCCSCWSAGQPANALAELQLEGGRKLKARLVIAADGARSHLRHLADLRTTGWGYGQVHNDSYPCILRQGVLCECPWPCTAHPQLDAMYCRTAAMMRRSHVMCKTSAGRRRPGSRTLRMHKSHPPRAGRRAWL